MSTGMWDMVVRRTVNHQSNAQGFLFVPSQPCHPERNFVSDEAADKVESKDPYTASPADIVSRHSHQNAKRAVPNHTSS